MKGRVLGPKGEPLGGAWVTLDSYEGSRAVTWMGDTDADGRFTWPDAPSDGLIGLIVDRSPFVRWKGRPEKGTDGLVTIRLKTKFRVSGTVTDAETGRPIETFRLIPGQGPYQPRNSINWYGGTVSKILHGGKYDVIGFFPSAGGDWGGVSSLKVEAEGYTPGTWIGFRDDGGDLVHDFVLHKGRPLEGVVRGPDGKPLVGAEVWLDTISPPLAGYGVAGGRVDPSRAQPRGPLRDRRRGALPLQAAARGRPSGRRA